jgi:short subunit dehydrogenase-like uncharacterized protein
MRIAVYGATGHTARFVLAELLRRGHTPVAIGRHETKLAAAVAGYDGAVERRVSSLDSPESLDRALAGTGAVIHCAGPFLDTAEPLIEAALRTRVHYFDLAAEQGSALSTFERFDALARERDILVVPAAGFYGGFGDLLATAAMHGLSHAERIEIAIALDSWWPTSGTRRTGARNTLPRVTFSNGRLEQLRSPAARSWDFPEPFGPQDVLEVPLTETVLIARHLPVREIRNFINQTPLRDLDDPATPGPVAVDERGRSNQQFLVDVVARNGNEEHRVTAAGRDIYAVTAPIVVEAVERLCSGRQPRAGAFALGQLVDAPDFLETLAGSGDIAVTFGGSQSARTR